MCPDILFQVLAGLCGCPCVGVPEFLCASALLWHSQSVISVLDCGSMLWLERPLGTLCKPAWETPVLPHIHAFCSSISKVESSSPNFGLLFYWVESIHQVVPSSASQIPLLCCTNTNNFLSLLCTCSSSIAVSQQSIGMYLYIAEILTLKFSLKKWPDRY